MAGVLNGSSPTRRPVDSERHHQRGEWRTRSSTRRSSSSARLEVEHTTIVLQSAVSLADSKVRL
jgi:hypothetical protein